MQRTTNQKILLVFSIIEIVAAACAIILAFLAFAGGAILSGSTGTNDLIVEGMQLTDAEAGNAAIIASVVLLIAGIVSLIIGILGIRAANDNQKIKPVWVLAIIEVALGAIGVILAIVNSSGMGGIASNAINLVLSIVVLVVANNIKKEAFGEGSGKGEADKEK